MVDEAVWNASGGIVADGPFRGLAYVPRASWGSITPFLVGSYESELHDAIERAIRAVPERVVDIGAAEGYYAVGCAVRLPDAEVFAFDIDPEARALCREMADLNEATNVRIECECTPDRLDRLVGPGTLLIVDCEGCELHLLDPLPVPSLVHTTILVELHDFMDPCITRTVLGRFDRTHQIELYTAEAVKQTSRWSVVAGLPPPLAALAVDEGRPTDPHPMQWAMLWPRRTSPAHGSTRRVPPR